MWQINYPVNNFVSRHRGTLPVIRTCPHDGDEQPPGVSNTCVHSKMWGIDEFAIIGSANCNRRSFTHDSEVMAGIFDGASNPLAKQLRVDLWAEHLNMHSAADRGKLADGVASAKYWLSPPAGARIAPYNENANIEWVHTDVTWDNIIDPDGS